MSTDKATIKPQKVQINNLYPGEQTSIKSTISVPSSLPIDLYIVLDKSNSMNEVRNAIVNNFTELFGLPNEIGASNIRLGIGLFNDKMYYPVVGDSTYEFEHVISLTANRANLTSELQSIESAKLLESNRDNPQSAYTAILQAATCNEQIGWLPSKESTKIIMVITDAIPKTAGDGINMGIVRRYLHKCELDEFGGYQNFRDYPDDNILTQELMKNDIKLVFIIANNDDALRYYTKISQELNEIYSKVHLLKNARDVINAIKDASTAALTKITIVSPPKDKFTEINVEAYCRKKQVNVLECENTGSINLIINIEALKCYPDTSLQNYAITIGGYAQIDLVLSTGCTCDCSDFLNSESYVYDKYSTCDNHGEFICGLCHCNDTYSGNSCECHESTSKCFEPGGDTSGLLCSGIGECSCNQCNCGDYNVTLRSGNYCECDDIKCQTGPNEFCSGESQGSCDCGNCVCEPKYTGNLCEKRNCTEVIWAASCIGENATYACNGRGICECGECVCDFGYNGEFCEIEIEGENCNKYNRCVACSIFEEERVKGMSCSVCKELAQFDIYSDYKATGLFNCITTYKQCSLYFSTPPIQGKIDSTVKKVIHIKKVDNKQDCMAVVSPVVVICSIVGGMLIISSISIIVVLFAQRQYYKMEYKRFLKSSTNT